MSKRLIDRYSRGEKVAISFGDDVWLDGIVVGPEHPGLWVRDYIGRVWFVTNTRRIRKRHDEQ